MVNLYDILNIPEDANVIAIQRAIRLARDRQDIEERYLKLAENYLLDDKRRAQYNKQMGIKMHARRNGLSVGSDKRYLAGGIMLVAVLVIPWIIVMMLQGKATEQIYQQKDGEYKAAQEAMEKAWGVAPASGETKPQAVQRTLDDITEKQSQQLEQTQ
ncbi:hypothetical protein LVJ82_13785 [Vitreoscilla massiliensis]|uniref:J domain-containing protein n=1 Tax=Vitreoscilla massiliensis TaxID=1689272 RepID=A0ABY4DZ58_9NEIS|nr:hypothetical protein [Vitreoscilla massiliensis]UOO88529.1 hypothetical protein LVJ82_13785 [Vitreoscilla massiliensis]